MLDERQAGLLTDVSFFGDAEKQDAVLRRFEIIGEAASRLAPDTQARFPSLPFRAMRGMRNIIAHDYGEVDLELVWKTASDGRFAGLDRNAGAGF